MGKKDVALVYPSTGLEIKGGTVSLPLSVLSVASTIVNDYRVKIIDQRTDNNWRETLKEAAKESPLCVGISSMSGRQIGNGLEAAKIAKDMGVTVVWGGVHATLCPEQTVKDELIDIVVAVMGRSHSGICLSL